MKSRTVPAPVDRFLTRTLSGTVFTWREIWELLLPGVLDSLSIMFINMLITALISKNGESVQLLLNGRTVTVTAESYIYTKEA